MIFKEKGASGGIHLKYYKKLTQNQPIKKAKVPPKAVIPFVQHLGAACQPLVKPGDRVKIGTKIGDCDSFITSPVHSSISGVVKSIEKAPHPVVGEYASVIIENDGTDEKDPSFVSRSSYQNLPSEEIRKIAREAGIVGLGGATFPTHVKLTPPKGKEIDTLILNGAECEPYLTCDYRLMLERADDILKGAQIIIKLLGIKNAYIAIESNKPQAIKVMEKATQNAPGINITVLKTKYPQGAEKQLIKEMLKKEVPQAGLPLDIGVLVHNVGTTLAIYEAVAFGKPLYERVVTITGPGIKQPGNYLARVGTPVKQLIEEAGGYSKEPKKIIIGGPMMGLAQYTDEVPVVKGTTGVLIFTKKQAKVEKSLACMRCGRCATPRKTGRRCGILWNTSTASPPTTPRTPWPRRTATPPHPASPVWRPSCRCC